MFSNKGFQKKSGPARGFGMQQARFLRPLPSFFLLTLPSLSGRNAEKRHPRAKSENTGIP